MTASKSRLFASPLARRVAADRGVDLRALMGSGPNGRIVRADVEAFHRARSVRPELGVPAAPSRPAAPGMDARKLSDLLGMTYKALPNSPIRKVIAQRLQESKQTVPHFYLTIDCRIDALMKLRAAENKKLEKDGVKLSVNDFIIRAAALALRDYPAANTAWSEDAILQYNHADISVAVSTPLGLMTPIVKGAEGKTVQEISAEVKELAAKAKDGKLKPTEFQGGTFTVSNLGMFGIKDFGAIINPPQACILAVGAGAEQPVVMDGKLAVGTVMSCTLSVDHRAVDGAVGAEFLQIFKKYIENPDGLLI